jgi:hypothetical protein
MQPYLIKAIGKDGHEYMGFYYGYVSSLGLFNQQERKDYILNKIDTLNDDELNDMVKLVNDSSLTIDVLNFQLTRNIIMTNNKEKLEEVFHNG